MMAIMDYFPNWRKPRPVPTDGEDESGSGPPEHKKEHKRRSSRRVASKGDKSIHQNGKTGDGKDGAEHKKEHKRRSSRRVASKGDQSIHQNGKTGDGKDGAEPGKKSLKPSLRPRSERVASMNDKRSHKNEMPKGTRQKNKTSAASTASPKTRQAKETSQNAGKGKKTKPSIATSNAAKRTKTTATATSSTSAKDAPKGVNRINKRAAKTTTSSNKKARKSTSGHAASKGANCNNKRAATTTTSKEKSEAYALTRDHLKLSFKTNSGSSDTESESSDWMKNFHKPAKEYVPALTGTAQGTATTTGQQEEATSTATLTRAAQGATKTTGKQVEATSTATLSDVAWAELIGTPVNVIEAGSGTGQQVKATPLINNADSQAVQHKTNNTARTLRLLNRISACSTVSPTPPKKKLQRGRSNQSRRCLPMQRNRSAAAGVVGDEDGGDPAGRNTGDGGVEDKDTGDRLGEEAGAVDPSTAAGDGEDPSTSPHDEEDNDLDEEASPATNDGEDPSFPLIEEEEEDLDGDKEEYTNNCMNTGGGQDDCFSGEKRKKKGKRSIKSTPKGTSELKDRVVRAKFDTVAKHVQELQFATTIQDDFDRKNSPKVQHFMVTYDELVQKPHFSSNKRSRVPKSIFFVPEYFNVKEFGKVLKEVGQAMLLESGKGYFCTDDKQVYEEMVFGEKMSQYVSRKKYENIANV